MSKCGGVPCGRLPEILGHGSLLILNIFHVALYHLFVQTFNWKINGYKMVCGVHTTALQTVTGPQTTVWLLYSVPNCAGVALSSEWLVYSLYSFQPLACLLPVRVALFILLHSPARKGNSSSQARAFLPFLVIPGTFVSNSQGRILKISSS